MVEHLTADQEVPSSNLGAPCELFFLLFLGCTFFIVIDSSCFMYILRTLSSVCRLVIQVANELMVDTVISTEGLKATCSTHSTYCCYA